MAIDGGREIYSNVHPIRANTKPDENYQPEWLKSGGGGGNSGDMERRLTLVEDAVRDLRRDTGEIKVDVATLKERIAHLPGKGFIVSVSLTSLIVITALITFADKIQSAIR
jgi:hypothetical protein